MEPKVITDMEKGVIHNGLNFDMRKYYWGWLKLQNEIGETEEGVEQLKLIRDRAGILQEKINVMEYLKIYLWMISERWFKMRDI